MSDTAPGNTVALRVAHVLPIDAYRGAQVFARELCDALNALGDQHHVAVAVYGPVGGALGGDCLGVRLRRSRFPMWDRRAARELRSFLRAGEFDTVVFHGSGVLRYAQRSVPSAATVVYLRIGVDTPAKMSAGRRLLYRAWQRRADHVVGVSRAALDDAISIGLPPSVSLHVIPNGRDEGIFRPAAKRLEGQPLLIFVGQLEPGKRPEMFLDVVSELQSRGVSFKAAIVGDGPLRAHVSDRADALGVELLGHRRDVPELMQQAHVLLLTSRPPEGMPGVLIEAGMCAVPAVATAVPGSADVIINGETGFVVPVDELGTMADAVERLLIDPDEARRMGAAARVRCARHFTVASQIEAWAALLGAPSKYRPVTEDRTPAVRG